MAMLVLVCSARIKLHHRRLVGKGERSKQGPQPRRDIQQQRKNETVPGTTIQPDAQLCSRQMDVASLLALRLGMACCLGRVSSTSSRRIASIPPYQSDIVESVRLAVGRVYECQRFRPSRRKLKKSPHSSCRPLCLTYSDHSARPDPPRYSHFYSLSSLARSTMQTRAAHTRLAFMPAVAVAFCFAGAAVAASAELGRLPSVDAFKKITLDDAVRKAASDIVPESWLVPAYDSNEWSFDQAAGTDKWAILVLASGEGKPMETITRAF